MRISGFSMVRNALLLDYPIVESIRSILPICDEFVIAIGKGDDGTPDAVRGIGDPKVRIIETEWDPSHFVHGKINAVQTNMALDACTGDWCFYLQADEVVHEEDLPIIQDAMKRNLDDARVEGLLFDYLHFWGSYETYQTARNWYRREVRVVRGGIGVRSWKSAQGFRIDGRKLRVRHSGGRIFHYGWVRHPHRMRRKTIALDRLHHEENWVRERHPDPEEPFRYGTLKHLARYRGTHPAVMRERIAAKDWKAEDWGADDPGHEHNRLGTRLLTWVENKILRTRLGEYRNYVLLPEERG
ncbi:MAG: glycosyltransferase [Candidatus Eisenbacteria bacterium]|nr:glycosyltransferase [Candidatus Eisenbacteria bacterium]